MFVDSRAWRTVVDVESVFEFVDELGTGSMAQVFSAVDRKSRASVALKVVPRSALEDAEVLDSLSVEVELLRTLHHPGIVALQEPPVVCDAQSVAVVLERLDGGDVQTLLQHSGALPEARARAIFSDVMQALAYLHEQGIVHRDVKAANLLLTGDGVVKLADFGVAVRLSGTLERRSTAIGTPHWMAPEVIQEGEYCWMADVWSLGITAIELAEMYPPLWHVKPTVRALFRIPTDPPPSLSHPAEWSEEFVSFVGGCLRKDAAERLPCAALAGHPFLCRARISSALILLDCFIAFSSAACTATARKRCH